MMTNELTTVDGAALTEAQTAILTQKTPRAVIKHRPGPGGKKLSYVEHAWVTSTLNQAFGWAWSWDIVEWRLMPEDFPVEVFVLGKLTIHTARGDLVKSQFGSSAIKRNRAGEPLSIGDDLKAASSDALKKTASLLGLALDLYSDDVYTANPDSGNGRVHNGAFRSPSAAIDWAMDQGAFDNRQHAQNAYHKLKEEKQPTTASEMAELWRADVAQRLAEKS